jgi:hypothetical protein
MEKFYDNLPGQKGPTCGACATYYYLLKMDLEEKMLEKNDEKIYEKINEIYANIKFKEAEGSHPNKIVEYLKDIVKDMGRDIDFNLYCLKTSDGIKDKVNKVESKWKSDIIEAQIDNEPLKFKDIDKKLTDVLVPSEKYGLGIYMPKGWIYENAESLVALHYMLTKKNKEGKIQVIDSNSPKGGWKDLNEIDYDFSGLLIKTKIE